MPSQLEIDPPPSASPAPEPEDRGAYVLTWAERKDELRPYIGPAIAIVVVLGVIGWAVWHALAVKARPAAVAERRMPTVKTVTARDTDEGRLAILDQLIARQTELMRAQRGVDRDQAARLQSLEEERKGVRARLAHVRVTRAEAEASAAVRAGDRLAAQAAWKQAWQAQHDYNANVAPTDADLDHEEQLKQKLETVSAETLHQRITEGLAKAAAAEKEGRWADAVAARTAAKNAQANLNSSYPSSQFADTKVLEQMTTDIASAGSAELQARMAAAERDAKEAEARGAWARAAQAAGVALSNQRDINASFAGSRYASVQHLDELDVWAQTLASHDAVGAAVRLGSEVNQLLRSGDEAAALEKANEALRLLEGAAAKNPRSQKLETALWRQLSFVQLKQAELHDLRQQILNRAVVLPGRTGAYLFASEVPQRLFERIMNRNPSRHIGPELPVECVSWAEAAAFCERVQWLVGRPTRLPTRDEFDAAGTRQFGTAWMADNANGHTHAVATGTEATGRFGDLTGNVAEWLFDASAVTAPVAGGSFASRSTDTPRRTATELKSLRSPEIGFRFVILVTGN